MACRVPAPEAARFEVLRGWSARDGRGEGVEWRHERTPLLGHPYDQDEIVRRGKDLYERRVWEEVESGGANTLSHRPDSPECVEGLFSATLGFQWMGF